MELDIFLYFLLLLVISIYGFIKFRRLSLPFRLLTIFVFSAFISESIARLLTVLIKNSCPPYHVFCMLNYWLFAAIYYSLFTSQAARRFIILSGILFTIFAAINSCFVQPVTDIPLFNIIISNLLYIVMSLLLFLQMLGQPVRVRLARQSIFWLNIAVLVYSVIMPICIGLMTYMITSRRYSEIVMNFNEVVTCLYYGTLGYAIFIDQQKTNLK